MGGTKVVVYGLSTEGYSIASQMAIKVADVYIIDESTPSAISLKAEIAKNEALEIAAGSTESYNKAMRAWNTCLEVKCGG